MMDKKIKLNQSEKILTLTLALEEILTLEKKDFFKVLKIAKEALDAVK